MNLTDYYNKQFGPDLLRIMNAEVYSQMKISMIVFSNRNNGFNKGKKLFQSFDNKEEFLISYFFTALLDQVMYTKLDHIYYDFQKLTKYPKIVGFLSSSNTNMSPENLLLLASYWSRDLDNFKVNINIFTEVFFNNIEAFLKNELFVDMSQYRIILKTMLVHLLEEKQSENHWCLSEKISPNTLAKYKDSIYNITSYIKQKLDEKL